MRELRTTTEQAALLPKASDGLYLTLFYRSSVQPRAQCEMEPIAGFELVAVDLDNAPALAERFVLPIVPALAAIFDGTILCIEDQLTPTTCRELAALALVQQRALLEVPA